MEVWRSKTRKRDVSARGVLPPLVSQPRKQDQYKTLTRLKSLALTDENTYCRHALKTTPTVNRTNSKFNQEMAPLTKDTPTGPPLLNSGQLDRLKHCSRTFSVIIENCPSHNAILTEIKRGYDQHLNDAIRLIEHEGNLDNGIPPVWRGNESHDKSHHKDVIIRQVRDLERDAVNLLIENERLEGLLSKEREEMRVQLPAMDEDTPSNKSNSTEGLVEYVDHVTQLQQQILDHRREANESINLRSGQVPLSVCQKLEQCIRSTELNIQQLKKQNSILLHNVQELEGKLQRYFDVLRTPQSDIKAILDELQKNALQ